MDISQIMKQKLFADRHKNINNKFSGFYRAVVVETNDPLCMNRIRFKCPEMHNYDIQPEECPWAVCALDSGGSQSGKMTTPIIGDHVWITFEKNSPYAPVWVGYATPTMTQDYPLPLVSTNTPTPLQTDGNLNKVKDYDENYLPKDGRPLIYGYQDRYGNMDVSSAVGYYPQEHEVKPPPIDSDPLSTSMLLIDKSKPVQNSPDKKYMLRATRYGHIYIMSDQGYSWHKASENDEFGEIRNSKVQDKQTNIDRYLYMQRLLNEDKPDTSIAGADQRRIETLSRYGHKIECRDVGWAQPGPSASKSRQDEYGVTTPTYLSRETIADHRWIKIRTKGGMLFQAYDKGFDPQNDNFIKRNLIDEVGDKTEKETEYWDGKDARFIRIVTRHGYKFVLDDRGTDSVQSENTPEMPGNGVLLKGRRFPGCVRGAIKRESGFYIEFNEKDELNQLAIGSPAGQSLEINDKYQYSILAAGLGGEWSSEHQGLKENEFIGKAVIEANPEANTHHLKLDLDNEYIRFKTRANKGPGAIFSATPSGVGAGEINQGLEARDSSLGDGPWVELVDCQSRGIFFSKKFQMGVWRASAQNSMYIIQDDSKKSIFLHNNETTGELEIYCANNIKIIAEQSVNIQAGNNINMSAGGSINLQARGSKFSVEDIVRTSTEFHAKDFKKQEGGNAVLNVYKTSNFQALEPSDRGKTYNGPFDAVPRSTIEKRLG